AQFTEMGLDSLLLTQAALNFKKRFAVPVTFRQLSDELSSLATVVDYVLPQLPSDKLAALAPAPEPTTAQVAPGPSALPVAAAVPSPVASLVNQPHGAFQVNAPVAAPGSPQSSSGDATQLLIQQQLQ